MPEAPDITSARIRHMEKRTASLSFAEGGSPPGGPTSDDSAHIPGTVSKRLRLSTVEIEKMPERTV